LVIERLDLGNKSLSFGTVGGQRLRKEDFSVERWPFVLGELSFVFFQIREPQFGDRSRPRLPSSSSSS
jgi:hypothetical protein